MLEYPHVPYAGGVEQANSLFIELAGAQFVFGDQISTSTWNNFE
jgi:hypothetical protein